MTKLKMKIGFNIGTVIAAAVLLRLILFVIIQPWNLEFETHQLFYYDPQEYHELAKAMLGWDFLDNTIRTPGYPVFIAFFYWIFGVNLPLVYAVQLMLSVFSVFMTYKIARMFFGEKTSLVAGSLLALDPHLILFSFNLLSEALFIPVILVMTYYLIKYYQTETLKYLLIATVFMAASAYIRPVTLYLAPAMLPLYLILGKGSWKQKLKSWGLMTALFFVLLSPWYMRNYVKFDSWSFCTTGGYNILYVYAASIDYANRDGGTMDEVWSSIGGKVDSISGGPGANPFTVEKAQRDIGLEMIKKDPVTLIQNHFIGVFNIFFSISSYRISKLLGIEEVQLTGSYYGETNVSKIGSFIKEKGVFSIFLTVAFMILFVVEYSTAILGAIVLAKEKNYVLLFTSLFLLVYLLGLTGLFGFQARFKLPLMPYYLLFSAYGMFTIKEWYIRRKTA